MTNGRAWRKGIKDGIPICLGYFAVSFAFGIQASDLKLSAFQSGMLSLLNLTSAGQFAGLSVIASGGSYLEMAAVQFVINLRYLLMSAALSQKLLPSVTTAERLGIAYGVTDEIFGVSALTDGPLSPFYSYGLIAAAMPGWVAGTVLGASAGAILPERLISALGIALYGMFIAIIVPPARKQKSVLAAVLLSMGLSAAGAYLPLFTQISAGMRIIFITASVSALCAIIWPKEEDKVA